MSTAMIEVESLTKRFGSRAVLNGMNWSVPRGSVVGLVGTNGSGKSTLIKCLLGLLKPTSGAVRLFGESSWNLSAAAKERLGYVPQTVQLYPWMTVDQITRYVGAFYRDWDAAWVSTLLDRCRLPRNSRIAPLSPGELQKLALILAIGHRPDLLILDEPVASLDPVARREFLRSLLELTGDNNHTVLFSTHITSDLERVASHVALLQDGKIAVFDELDDMKDRVKRLRIVAENDLPQTFTVPGALRTRIEGRKALVAVSTLNEQLIHDVENRWQAEVSVEDLNLEDIFLELHHD